MGAGFSDIVSYFEQEHPGFHTVDKARTAVTQQVRGENDVFSVVVVWQEDAQRISFWVREIMRLPEGKRISACVLMNMINWGLALGDFEMDMHDGELMVNLTFDVEDGTLGSRQIATHLMAVIEIADLYYPAFQKLVWADMSPEEALASVERKN